MENSFDIMKVRSDDSLAWLETASELAAARLRVWELLADEPGEYIVFNQETKTLVAHFSPYEAPQVPEWWRQEDELVAEPQLAPVAELSAAPADDSLLDDEYVEYFHVLQPVA